MLSRIGLTGGIVVGVAMLCFAAGSHAQASPGQSTRQLITQTVDANKKITLAGNTRPEANAKNDVGRVADGFAMDMMLQLQLPAEKEQELEQLTKDLEDATSPKFHKWLTGAQFKQQFSLAPQDVTVITNWLESQGFKVNYVYPRSIDFSGTAGQVRSAFGTEIHNLEVNGEKHYGNMSDPQIPAALAPAVVGVVSLHNFMPRPMSVAKSQYTIGGGTFAVVPADLATIYNLNPQFTAGNSGRGQTIVLLEDSDVFNTADWSTFRSTMGLSSFTTGSFTQIHPAPGSAGTCTDPGVTGDDGEATIDVEWASAGAPGAAIVLASCANTSNFGAFIAMQNLISESGTPPSIMSLSYGGAEAVEGAAANAYVSALYQQAVSEGVSIFASTGDNGAALNDRGNATASHGINISAFASTQYNVAVGGTDFGDAATGTTATYWSPTNSATFGSALSYIPEIPWNSSCASVLLSFAISGSNTTYGTTGFCNSTQASTDMLVQVVGGTGGPSACATGVPSTTGVVSGTCAGTPKPTWQSVFGNPNDGVRDTPDVSLFAADGVWGHFYVVCFSDPATGQGGAPCTGAPSTWSGFGGTSVSTPIMASFQALVNANTGSSWGNPNPTYYSLASTEYGVAGSTSCNSSNGNTTGSTCIFYDVTQGDMDQPCTGANNCFLPSGTNGVLSTGPVGGATVIAGGSGYTSAPSCAIAAPSNKAAYSTYTGGVQALCTATVTAGAVSAINITTAGAGYAGNPICTLTGGGGTGATCRASTGASTAYQPAFGTGVGWDNATGIGTVNASNLVNQWPTTYKVTATSGTPQSATVNTAFANRLVATVTSGGVPASGVIVTFNAPASGASGTFTGANTSTTNGAGVATSNVFTANATPGAYLVTTSITGSTATVANFSLTNLAPTPVITSLVPPNAATGGAAFTLTVNGTGFVSTSVVNFNSNARATTFVSATQITAAILASDISTAGTFLVTVTNPAPGGGTSNTVNFTVSGANPAPTLTSIAPTSGTAGGAAFTLTLNGTGFITGSVANFNGVAQTTTFVSATQITAAITAAEIATAGSVPVTVTNPTPGGGTSAAQTFTINNAAPTIATLVPTSATAGGAAFTLTVNGTGFIATSSVKFNGNARTTTFVSATQVTAAILASDIATAGAFPVTVTNAAPGGGTSTGVNFTVNSASNPVPTLTSIAPTNATAGGAAFTLTLTGTNFISGSKANFNGVAQTTTFVSATQITAAITAADIATAGTFPVTVTNAAPGGGTSAAQTFTVNNPAPTITTLAPTSATEGGAAFTLTLNGTGFVATSAVKFNGNARTTTFVSATQITAAITVADIATAGTFPVTVTNAAPGGGTSAGVNFVVNNGAPTIASLAPTSANAGGAAFTLTVNGTNFVSTSVVNFNGVAQTTTFVSATQVTAAITAAEIATGGTFPVTVTNPAPGGGTSAASNFAVNNTAPVITSLNPSTVAAGGAAFTLTVNGTGFVSTSSVKFNGNPKTTTFVSATQITAAILASDIASTGNDPVTVVNPAPGGGTSTAVTFIITAAANPVPTLTSIAPTSGTAGQNVVLVLTGTNFVLASVVNFGANADTGGVVSNGGNTLTITIPGAQLAAAGPVSVTVTNPAPGGGTTAVQTFTVNNPAPVITSLNPATATVGGAAFTLTVNGTGFVNGTTVNFNGAARATTFVSATQMTAAILAGDVAAVGTFPVTATNAAPGGGTSAAVNFSVTNPPPTETSLLPTSATAGGAAFTLTVNGTGFVNGAAVNFNGVARVTTFVNATQITAAILASDIATAGTFPVTVTNPAPGGGTSTALTFTVNNVVPTITTLAPTNAIAGGAAFTLTVNGTGFVNGAVVNFNGTAATTTFVSATQVTAAITAAEIAAAGTFAVTVTNPAPGGGASTAVNFTVNNGVPTITTLAPVNAIAGGAAFTLTVNGTNFVSTSVVNFNGAARVTTFANATKITAAITAADIAVAGTVNVTVTNPAPGGGTSGPAAFAINNPVPTITSLAPTSATVGGAAFTLTVNGTNFVSTSVVNFNGAARVTTFVSATKITAAITAGDITAAGTANVTVTNPAPGGGTSAAAPFAINNATPVLTSLAPTSTIAGSVAFTLTVNGTGFVSGAIVNFNGAARVTTFVSGVQVAAAITAADVATVGSISVTVTNPAPTAGASAALTFTVNNPVPTVTTLGNTHAPGGTAFTLTVNGTNFVAGSVVNFNGKAEVTTFVSATQVTAAIPMGDVSTGGSVPVTVTNPAPGGGTTASTNFTIDDYALSAPTSTATVIAGQPAVYTITATPGTNGFAAAITFSAAVVGGGALPKGVGVAFVPATITPNATATSTMLTITTTARSLVPLPPAQRPSPQVPVTYKLFGVLSAALAMAIFAASQLKMRQWRTAALIPGLVIVLGVLVIGGCSSEFAGGNPVGTPAGTTQIQVTASSGTLSHTTMVTLTVQ